MAAPVAGWRLWGPPVLLLVGVCLAPVGLLLTPLAPLAITWMMLWLLAGWLFAVASFIGALTQVSTPPIRLVERAFRRWVARFAPDPEALWLHWARSAHTPAMAGWCLERAVALGSPEALFQEALIYLEGGLGPGGQTSGAQRLARAAERGHPEAACRYAECLRTGEAGPARPQEAEQWYLRAAQAGYGPAAAWLAHAYTVGDGVAEDARAAARFQALAERLAPYPPRSHSLRRHDAAREDPLVRVQARAWHGLEQAMGEVVTRRLGRWAVFAVLALLVAGGLLVLVTLFWAGSRGLYHLPLILLSIPGAMLGWQAFQLWRERPSTRRDRLRERAEQGDPEACYQLGLRYQAGHPAVPRDSLEAARWFRRAADAGHVGAMQALAQAYLGGQGVLRDPREAARWSEAARHGSTS